MTALLINLKIDENEKFELFKITFSDIAEIFDELHIKIRGLLSHNCIDYIKNYSFNNINFYQELQELDWINATLEMLENVKSRSIFLFLEDHKLLDTRKSLAAILTEFDVKSLDYLCYSFFRANQLGVNNLLPLNPIQYRYFSKVLIDDDKLALIGKISPSYCSTSLVGVFSLEFFRAILQAENKRFKIYNKLLSFILSSVFGYPKNKYFLNLINNNISWLNSCLCIYNPSSPFNLEKIWFEFLPRCRQWSYGFLRRELFANYDDDNGADGESLIKRGLYPFNSTAVESPNALKGVQINVALKDGAVYDCFYHCRRSRIRKPPMIKVHVLKGEVEINYQSANMRLLTGENRIFYSNLRPFVSSRGSSVLEITIYDEYF